MGKNIGFITSILFATAFTVAEAQYVPANLNFDGKLIDNSNNPITNPSVTFKFELLDQSATCVLYSEQHTGIDLSTTGGAFSLKIGNGTSKQNFLQSTTNFSKDLFFNSGVASGAFTGCAPGVTMAPGEGRRLRVSYDTGGGLTVLTPDYQLSAIPHAMVAESLEGKSVNDLLQVRDDVGTDLNQTNLENVFSATNFAKLLQLLNGTFTAAYSFNNQRVTGVAAPTAGTDAANKDYTDANIGGKTADTAAVSGAAGDGFTLVWNQSLSKWVAAAPTAVDNTKLPLAGGTMTGAINMGGQNITAAGHITMSAQRSLNLGTFNSAQESTLIGTLGTGNAGSVWYNTNLNQLKVWNGSSAVDVLAGNTAVVPGSYGTTSQIPTFSVTSDGRLISAGQVTPTFPTSVLAQGTASAGNVLTWNGAAWLPQAPGGGGITALNGDVSASGVGSVTATLASNSVTSAKISTTGIAINRLLMTDPTTGNSITYATCSNDEVLKYNSITGWGCGADNNSDSVVSVAGKTGAVTLVAADITDLGTSAVLSGGNTLGAILNVGTNDNFKFNLKANGSTLMTLDPSGNVGIGIVSPAAPLHISSTVDVPLVIESNAAKAGINLYRSGAAINSSISSENIATYNSLAFDVQDDANPELVVQSYTASLGKVGINTSNPWSVLTVVSDGSSPTIAGELFSNTAPAMPTIELHRGRGTAASPTDVLLGDKLGAIGFHGFAAGFSSMPGARISAKATENWTGSAHGSDLVFETAPNGSGVLNPNMIIAQNGNVGIGTTAPNASLDLGMKTDALLVPKGTTAQRPGGASGMIRFNTTTSDFEYHNGSVWMGLNKPQVVTFAGNYIDSGITPGSTYYAPVQGSSTVNGGVQWTSDAFERRTVLNRGGNLKNLYVKMSQAPTADWIFTILINGTPSGLTCTVLQPSGTFCSMVGGSAVAPGDMISIRINTAGATGAAKASWAVDLEFP